MGWLEKLTAWIKGALLAIFAAGVHLVRDLILWNIERCMEVYVALLNQIPVPDFLTQYSLGPMLAATGPTMGWLLMTFRIPECLVIIGAGWAFRLTRKALTLGQW